MKRLLASIAITTALASMASAQTLYSVSGGVGGVFETNGPPGACGYPTGPGVSGFPYAMPFGCPLPGPFAPPPGGVMGDIGVNRIADTIWVTDGLIFGNYTSGGVPLNGFFLPAGMALPGPVTSLDVDPVAGVLWISDGVFVNAIVPPPPPGCALPGVMALPFATPAPGFIQDITWDPSTGSLIAVDAFGAVTSFVPGGAVGPYGPPFFGMGPPCAMPGLAGLTGIAFDTTTPTFFGAPATVYITDGVMVKRIFAFGPAALAPPTFYAPIPCFPLAGPASSGLGFAARPNAYGVGTDSIGAFTPVAGTLGEATTPNPGFALTLAGCDPTPGTMAGLFYSFVPACPSFTALKGNTIYILPPLIDSTLLIPVVGGGAVIPIGLPPGLPVGAPAYLQWFIMKGSGKYQVTNALELDIGLP